MPEDAPNSASSNNAAANAAGSGNARSNTNSTNENNSNTNSPSNRPKRRRNRRRHNNSNAGDKQQRESNRSKPRGNHKLTPEQHAAFTALRQQIDHALPGDRDQLQRRLRGVERSARSGRRIDKPLGAVTKAIEQSVATLKRRTEERPTIKWPEELPVVQKREEIAKAISENQVVVICGETGSGKTTQLPKICLDLGRGVDGIVGHTQPRRIAARSLANRISEELESPLGKTVGFKIRFRDQVSDHTLVKVMTDGILLAETQGDPELRQYDTLIIDEAHERSLNIDFLLGYLKRLLPRRPDLKLIITSATIDPERFSKHFDDCPIVEVSGRTYPVEVRYRPRLTEDPDEMDLTEVEAIVDAVRELDRSHSSQTQGDVLVFLAGERQIRETAEALRGANLRHTEVLPLYSRLASAEQDRIFKKHSGRRIVLATNVAETSLTVPGIRYVIDPGDARISRYSPRSKVQRLPIEKVSQASADQRKGRCGRVSEGVCIRLYSEDDFYGRPMYTDPEILRTNLAEVILQMKALRLGHMTEFPFLDPPSTRLVSDGLHTLREIGALNAEDELTPIGRDLARLPLDPRIGRMILAAREENCLHEVLIIASALSVQDPRERPMEQQQAADEQHEQFHHETSDFLSLLKLYEIFRERKRALTGGQLRKWCKQSFLSYMRMREWQDVHRQLREMVLESEMRINHDPADEDKVHRALLAGLLSHVGLRKTKSSEYDGAGGRSFSVFPGSGLFKNKPKWIVAAELVETTKLYARTVAKIDPEWLEEVGAHLIKRSYRFPEWSENAQVVHVTERVSLFGLPVVRSRKTHYGPINPREAREIFIREALVNRTLRTNARFMAHNAELFEEAKQVEAKARGHSLVIGEQGMFAWYDQRLPAGIYNRALFERWHKEASRKGGDPLVMSLQDLLTRPLDMLELNRFPDSMQVGRLTLPLSYHAEGGHPDDGVTIDVPLPALNQLATPRLTYLVPGMLRDKIIALIKTLPKNHRRNLVPAPDTADAVVDLIEPSDTVPMPVRLSQAIKQARSVEVPSDLWDLHALPDHMRMQVRVVDRHGKEVAKGREPAALQRELRQTATRAFATLAGEQFVRDNITRWDFGDLPDKVEVEAAGIPLTGYPALIDKGKHIQMTLMDRADLAKQATRPAIRRLLMLTMPRELAAIEDNTAGLDELVLHYRSRGPRSVLIGDFLEAVIQHAFLDGVPPIRTQIEFENRLEAGWHKLRPEADKLVKVLQPTLNNYHAVAVLLDQLRDQKYRTLAGIVEDVQDQLNDLLFEPDPDNHRPGFITATPIDQLRHYPRYFAAAHTRLKKAIQYSWQRDESQASQLRPYIFAFRNRLKSHQARGVEDPALQDFHWMVEEMRVQLFAQELKTAGPVSFERLQKQWAKVRL